MKNLKVLVFILIAVLLVTIPLMGACGEDNGDVTPPPENGDNGDNGDVTPPEPIELTLGTENAATHPQSLAILAWIDKIEEETNGQVTITPYWSSTLTTEEESYAEVVAGVADIGIISAALWSEVGFDILKGQGAFFYGIGDPDMARLIYDQIRADFPEIDAEFADVKMLASNSVTPFQLLTKVPIRSFEDIQGLTIKCPPQYVAALTAMGAEGTFISEGEVYISLEKGILDGTLSPYESLLSSSIAEVVSYATEVNFSLGPIPMVGMNMDTWNSLPADIQQVFEDNSAFLGEGIEANFFAADPEGIAYAEDLGVEFIELSAEELEKFFDILEDFALDTAAELDALGLPGTEIFEEVRSLYEEYSS